MARLARLETVVFAEAGKRAGGRRREASHLAHILDTLAGGVGDAVAGFACPETVPAVVAKSVAGGEVTVLVFVPLGHVSPRAHLGGTPGLVVAGVECGAGAELAVFVDERKHASLVGRCSTSGGSMSVLGLCTGLGGEKPARLCPSCIATRLSRLIIDITPLSKFPIAGDACSIRVDSSVIAVILFSTAGTGSRGWK